MSELPGYDAWKLASPDNDAYPCVCSRDVSDHGVDDECIECDCDRYTEYTRDDYEDDMRERRAEARSNW